MSKTEDNLKKAFAGKSQSNQKYRLYAKRARKEGLPNIARLFKITSEAEKIQAEGDLLAFTGEKSTLENLKSAIAGKINKFKNSYPEMVKQADTDNHAAKAMFENTVKLERAHLRLYLSAYESLKSGKDILQSQYYLCPRCGNIEIGVPQTKCDICNITPDKFIKVGV
jgi:rubrerythrin